MSNTSTKQDAINAALRFAREEEEKRREDATHPPSNAELLARGFEQLAAKFRSGEVATYNPLLVFGPIIKLPILAVGFSGGILTLDGVTLIRATVVNS